MWNIIYWFSLALATCSVTYYVYLWGFSFKSFVLIAAMLVCGYMMGQMVDRMWFGDDK